jgi:hypothetical protein
MKEKIHSVLTSEWSNSRSGHFIPEKELLLPSEHEGVWAPEPVETSWLRNFPSLWYE